MKRLQRLVSGLFLNPLETLLDEKFKLKEGILFLLGWLVLSNIQSFLDAYVQELDVNIGLKILSTSLSLIAAWIVLTLIYHAAAYFLKGVGGFLDLLTYMAYSTIPMIIMTLLSILILCFSMIMPNVFSTGFLAISQTVLGWLGLTAGWTGFLAYFGLRYVEGLSKVRAAITVSFLFLILAVGWFLPVFAPDLYTF